MRRFFIQSCCVLVGLAAVFSNVNIARTAEFGESPALARQVENGTLPPAAERLPRTPMILTPVEKLGTYGGTWHMAQRADRDHALLIRTIGYEPLLRWTPQWTDTMPNVAMSYQTNEDATEFTFRLRPGMRWSDGMPFGADDIVFWYEDILKNPDLSPVVPDWLTTGDNLVEIDKIDDQTVRFRFSDPYGLFPMILARPEGVEPVSYPAHFLKKLLPEYNPNADEDSRELGFANWQERFVAVFGQPGNIDHPTRWQNPAVPTLNAWQLTGVYGKDDPLIATRNPYYWKIDPAGRQLPYIDQVSFKLVPDRAEAVRIAITNGVNMQDRHVSDFADEILSRNPGLSSFTLIESDMNKLTLSLNLNHQNPELRTLFGDKDFRIALSHAIDRNAIIDRFIPGALPHQAAPRPESPLYHTILARQYLAYDPGLAMDALARAGLTDKDSAGFYVDAQGRRISFHIDTVGSSRYDMLAVVVDYWRDIGLDVTARDLSRDGFYQLREKNAHDATAWGGDGGLDGMLIPINYLPVSVDSWFAPGWAKWYLSPESLDAIIPPAQVQEQLALYDRLKRTANSTEQNELMRAILDISVDQFYVMGIALPPNRKGIVARNFRNVPKVIPAAWSFVTPAPTNPSQYYLE
ncbi:ABC transporter substrate-binding protein [Thalassospira sp.]|uniref:ABC transporter substrate-binding protein n=1 Tax=Thalassospira sp. TaxID=1912094 RepID=UPI002736CFFF|nr:ABC transporter substrate-binding protein [Thalassospira sp.]MDP2698860.1 ABC transporter substrate-binding protein [Thalassospira sp.]